MASDVSNVKTDVGGVKTNVAKTQSDLAGALSQLQSMKGDLSGHTSLIARNRDELELLKHKGDRNYYEFTLIKGQRKPVGTIGLELKKADPKRNSFSVDVNSDDKSVEKKNRGIDEPLPVLQRQGSDALRSGCERRQFKEPGNRIPFHAQRRAGSGYGSVTALWGASVKLG